MTKMNYKEKPEIISELEKSLKEFIKITPIKNGKVAYSVRQSSIIMPTLKFPKFPKRDLFEIKAVIEYRDLIQKVFYFFEDVNGVENDELIRIPLRDFKKQGKDYIKSSLGLTYFRKNGLNIYLSENNDFFSYEFLKKTIEPIIEKNLEIYKNLFEIKYLPQK